MKYFISIVVLAILCTSFSEVLGSVVCGGKSSSRKISLTTPFAPPRVCEYTIEAYSRHVCQIRIDFAMTLAQPDFPTTENELKVPECLKDYLQIGDLKLCGKETAQHVYVPIDKASPVNIIIATAVRKGISKLPILSWDFKITQLDCPSFMALKTRSAENSELEMRSSKDNDYLVAPIGCDQYFPDAEGTIQSFNFDDGKGIYPYNLNYVICFRRTQSTTGLQINASSFNIGLGKKENSTNFIEQIDNSCYPQEAPEGNAEDYLMIPQATVLESNIRANFFCGKSLNGLTVLSGNSGPLSIVFNSGGLYQKRVKSQGFSLTYKII